MPDADYVSPSWWRRALLRLAGFAPAAVWDCPDEPRVFYEDEWIPPNAQELWGRRAKNPMQTSHSWRASRVNYPALRAVHNGRAES